jgi:ergothioneine biosynthesis protein EgtB
MATASPPPEPASVFLAAQYRAVRDATAALAASLSVEDQVIQSMPDASPTKWHLAHTSWFFETFVLKPHLAGYRPFDPVYEFLFNSYYQQIGAQFPRPSRGLLSRPGVTEVAAYREHVDEAMAALLADAPASVAALVELGLNHEQQHQELIATDIKHALSLNPLAPAPYGPSSATAGAAAPLRWIAFDGGLREIGADGPGFWFDNEGPRHLRHLQPFALASRPVTNGEFLAFMEDGGYDNPALWLSDGWALASSEGWRAPLYWRESPDGWHRYTLHGPRPVEPDAPVCHVSFYEAAAYAAWCGCRLPEEAEWEVAAAGLPPAGRFLDPAALEPAACAGAEGLAQMFGDVWEWTMSAYAPYPRYRPAAGAIGEYNGKFMSGQMVLRGGSCATPAGHVRATYRNFFPPQARWQFSGFRLARDR